MSNECLYVRSFVVFATQDDKRGDVWANSVSKMTDSGENHRHLALIGSRNHFFIAHLSARLNSAGGTGIGGGNETMREWKKCIAGDSAAFEREPCFLRFPNRNPRRIDPRHLARPDCKSAVSRRVNDRI